ncbi:PGF-pre-PGF domain-containing protein [Halogranum rubrum]|uniref:PGF-pre-PGF domain-containing protein n=1 Tax=Halogranum salarium B-1 TaxID=1210908 RepID=J3EUS1_9EURY|nr:PGF-pre-PGF domain-containing protein [Halogranum salarium]EJN58167.1 hypothetical protein HSB1_35840 [Halogranum salarium B-1]
MGVDVTSRKLSTLAVATLLVLTTVVGTAPLNVAATGNTAGNVSVTGTIQTAGNDAVSDGFVHASTEQWEYVAQPSLGASGNFEFSAKQGETYGLGYYQYEESESGDVTFARDGIPDVYSLGSVDVDGETDLGTTTLPDAHLVTVSVVDERGTPVSGADVTTIHYANDGTVAGWMTDTNVDGQLQNYQNEQLGIEAAGNVELRVDPPVTIVSSDGAYEYVQKTYTRELTVTGERHVEIVVETRSIETDSESNDGVDGNTGGGSGGSAGQTDPTEITETDGVTHVSFEPEEKGALIRAPFENGVDAGNATIDRVAVAPTFDYGFELSIADNDSRPADSQALDGHTPIGSFDVETSLKDGEVDAATIKFTVDEELIPNVNAADVVLYRYHDGEWHVLDTEHKRGTTYLATTPGFSTFAIGLSENTDEATTESQDGTMNRTTETTATAEPTAEQPTESTEPPATTQTESPGFGVLVSLLSFVGFVFLARQR